MVKLKRMDEAQLNLFSWKPKNDVPINAPKVPSIKEVPTENNTGSIEDTYDGKEDVGFYRTLDFIESNLKETHLSFKLLLHVVHEKNPIFFVTFRKNI